MTLLMKTVIGLAACLQQGALKQYVEHTVLRI